jgi:diguanylate cyclase (GGDEF)-like protein/PAS domain S-box-containing protein
MRSAGAGSFKVRGGPVNDDGSHALTERMLVQIDEALAASHREVFDALDEAFCVIEMLLDGEGVALDCRFVETNRAYEDHTGLRGVVGRTVREALPDIEPRWIETYAEVARSGEPVRFVDEVASMRRWFDVYAWPLGRPGSRRVAVHFTDITQRKQHEDELRYRSEQFHALVAQAPIGVFLIDADFCILEVNPAARPAFGNIPDLIGRNYEDVLRILWPDAIADVVVRIARHVMQTGVAHHEPEMSGVRADQGNTEYYDWRMDRIRLPDGTDGVVCYFSDISEQVWARHALAVSEDRYRTLFESIDEGFCIVHVLFDENERAIDYRYVEINPAFERHTGLVNAVGKTVKEMLPAIEPYWADTYGRVALTGEPARNVSHVESIGQWFDHYAFRIGKPHEHKVAVLFTDITNRKHAEDELSYRSEQFHALIQQAPIGVYLIDAGFRLVEVNPAARPSFGDIPDLIGRDYDEVVRILWPPEVADEVLRIARHTLTTGVSHHEPETSGVRADLGHTEYYDWRMDRILLPDGTDGVVCYFSDISKQVRARHELAVSEHRYRTLFESIDEGFCILQIELDERGEPHDYVFLETNPAFNRQAGLGDVVGRSIRTILPEQDWFWIERYGRVAITGVADRFVEEVPSQGRWYDEFAFRVGDPEEYKVGVLFTDITERKRAEYALQESVALLRHHAQHDALTGLPNRVLFEDRLRLAVAAAERHGSPLTVLFLDLDDFKEINDDFGHESGDVVLIEVARRLRRSLRASDTLARIHGDEFVAILPDLGETHAAESMSRQLLAAINDPIDVAGTTVSVRASIGLSVFPADGTSPRALVRAADIAMYRAKLAGKNTVGHPTAEPTEGTRSSEPS